MIDEGKLSRRKAIRGFYNRNKLDVIGGLIMLAQIAGLVCMTLELIDTEAVRQIEYGVPR